MNKTDVSWMDRNWYLHEQDTSYLDPSLTSVFGV